MSWHWAWLAIALAAALLAGYAAIAYLALPIAAVLRETVGYLRRHLVFEPWSTSSPLIIGHAPPPPEPPPPLPGEPSAPDGAGAETVPSGR